MLAGRKPLDGQGRESLAASPARHLSARDQPIPLVRPFGFIFMDSDRLLKQLCGLHGHFDGGFDDAIEFAAKPPDNLFDADPNSRLPFNLVSRF